MKGLLSSALLGVLLASPVAAQIAGSGRRTETDQHLFRATPPPVPRPVQARAPIPQVEALSGGKGALPLTKVVDVRAAKRAIGTSGIRVVRGGKVTIVQPGAARFAAADGDAYNTQMKLIRVGTRPRVAYRAYGLDIAQPREARPERPPTIRVNP